MNSATKLLLRRRKTFDEIMALQPELITNGDFGTGTTAGFAAMGGATLSIVGGGMRILSNPDGSYSGANTSPTINAIVGRLYVAKVTLVSKTLGEGRLDFGGTISSALALGENTFNITATGTNIFGLVRFMGGVQSDYIVDNVSLKLVPIGVSF